MYRPVVPVYNTVISVYRPVVPVYTQFLDWSISAFQSISRNSEGHVESVQPIKCMIFIPICNNVYSLIFQHFPIFGPIISTFPYFWSISDFSSTVMVIFDF